MKEFIVRGQTGVSRILTGITFEKLPEYLPEGNVVIISDNRVAGLYGSRFPEGLLLTVQTGERSKNLNTVSKLSLKMMQAGVDRSWFLLGIGGGVVTDLAGFVAATYMRGISCGYAPTTLLAQVDAAIGGKNGVNLKRYKNMVGTIKQPRFVLCDPSVLNTLPSEEWKNGWAEVIKHGLIADLDYLDMLQREGNRIRAGNPELLARVIEGSVRIKSDIVNRDEAETGIRSLLNFGHTAGHAIEKMLRIPHGKAVSLGMVLAAGISRMLGLLRREDVKDIADLLQDYGLPVRMKVPAGELLRVMAADKKKKDKHMKFIVLEKPGRAKPVEIPVSKLGELVKGAVKECFV
ncbi:MAG: 3-dehydroquinate synthase [Bacteroidales bacterium]